MDIVPYIADLLKQQDEVILSGFGTFYKHRIDGFFDNEGGVFVPPSYQLVFKLSNSKSSALADYIIRKKSLSISSAKYFIEGFISSLKKDLEQKPVELPNLGILYKENDEYILKPKAEGFIDNSFFGLQPIKEINSEETKDGRSENSLNEAADNKQEGFQPASTQEEKTSEEEVQKPEGIIDSPQDIETGQQSEQKEASSEIETEVSKQAGKISEPVIEIKDLVYTLGDNRDSGAANTEQETVYTNSEDNVSSGWWKKLLLVILILAIIVVGTYLFYPQAFDTLKNFNTQNPVPVKIAPSMMGSLKTEDDSIRKADSIIQMKLEEQGFEVQKPLDTAIIKTTDQKLKSGPVTTYEIIIVSFDKLTEAEEYIRKMKKKGIDAFIVDQVPGNLIKVSLGSFTDKGSADLELKRIQKEINKEAWIFRHKTTN